MQLGVIGLSTMGGNLARNAARRGARVAVFNRTTEKLDAFMRAHGKEGDLIACSTLRALRDALQPPRPILLMVQAGAAVDEVIAQMLPHLDTDDIVIDAGNSHYRDSERRATFLKEKGLRFVGLGVSGGEEGALRGPSMMAGGDRTAYTVLAPLLTAMAADDGSSSLITGDTGRKCIAYFGSAGAGHFVKMIHNGIEYGLMQIIAESYDLLKHVGGYSNAQLRDTFAAWSVHPDLRSFLLEITAQIFTVADPFGKGELIDAIADCASQKGTGKWTIAAAHEYGVAIPTISSAVDARILSGDRADRTLARAWPATVSLQDSHPAAEHLRTIVAAAFELSSLCSYSQGFTLLSRASAEERWELDLAEVARVWRGGCIIRSNFLPFFQESGGTFPADRLGGEKECGLRRCVALGARDGIPLPAMSASLTFLDALRRTRLPQNLVAAQRDFFGAHTYARTDRPGTFHAAWAA